MVELRAAPFLACLTVVMAPTAANASPGPGEDDSEIFGAQAAESCQWPTTVLLEFGGTCTGTLVHPEIILYAAHCGTGFTEAKFGEDRSSIPLVAAIDHCERFSDSGQVSSDDYAYCRLAEPVTILPRTPVLYGCEEDAFEAGAQVAIVGFGRDEDGVVGIKRWAMTQVNSVLGLANIGGMGTGADEGDSGGPAFLQLEDGSWRTAALVTGGQGEGSAINYVPIADVVPWVESQSGVDITPCHDVDGTWAPTPECSNFALGPTTTGSWDDECPGPAQDAAESCGPPFTALDETPPEVAFLTPLNDEPVQVGTVVVVAEASDDGFGVAAVELRVDDEFIDRRTDPPYEFETDIAAGVHSLSLTAEDFVGLTANTTIEVEARADEEDPAETGCACTATRDGLAPPSAAWWLGFVALARRRRGTRSARARPPQK